MHGYHPADRHSFAALLTNQPAVPDGIEAIPDIFRLMTREADAICERSQPVSACATELRVVSAGTAAASLAGS
jgi:hypothetical protein